MSDTFTASDGVTLVEAERGELRVGRGGRCWAGISKEWVPALREFFLHERDKELGRWRWPERPEYVVYPKKPSMTEPEPGLRVVHETTGRSRDIRRSAIETYDAILSVFGVAARAYFAAHPEPRPWHDAKPGEVWAITTENVADEVAVQRTDTGDWQYCDGLTYRDHELKIETARRIWPEVTP